MQLCKVAEDKLLSIIILITDAKSSFALQMGGTSHRRHHHLHSVVIVVCREGGGECQLIIACVAEWVA